MVGACSLAANGMPVTVACRVPPRSVPRQAGTAVMGRSEPAQAWRIAGIRVGCAHAAAVIRDSEAGQPAAGERPGPVRWRCRDILLLVKFPASVKVPDRGREHHLQGRASGT